MAEVVVPLAIRDLTREDLPSCAWFGSARDLAQLRMTLERARRGEVDYLAVCPPSGLPVALRGVDYALTPGAGTLVLAVHGALQSCGIGTILIEAAEQRIRDRGLHRAELAVEEDNSRARALYERLGYAAYDSRPESWDVDAEGWIHHPLSDGVHADALAAAIVQSRWQSPPGPSSANSPTKKR